MTKAGRPLRWATGLLLSSLVVVGTALVVLREPSHQVDPAVDDAARASPAAAAGVLRELASGLQAHDAEAVTALAPDGADDAAELLRDVAANADALDVDDVSARFVEQVGTVGADGSWTAVVELGWRFSGYDRASAAAQVAVSFAPRGDGLGIAGFGSPTRSRAVHEPLWLQGPLAVASTERALVLVDGSQREARRVSRRVGRGVAVVQRVLPAWEPRVVVEVPATSLALDRALGADPGTFDGIAGVTAPVDGSTRRRAPVHVFVNPDVTSDLGRSGAQVVMSHELVHVATGAATSAVEPWLLEGFADYVALRDVGLPDATTLGRAIAITRREGVPARLPTAAQLGTGAPDLQAAYELSWLACRSVADRIGERGLVSVYRAAARGDDLDEALRRAGVPPDALLAAWQRELRRLLDG